MASTHYCRLLFVWLWIAAVVAFAQQTNNSSSSGSTSDDPVNDPAVSVTPTATLPPCSDDPMDPGCCRQRVPTITRADGTLATDVPLVYNRQQNACVWPDVGQPASTTSTTLQTVPTPTTPPPPNTQDQDDDANEQDSREEEEDDDDQDQDDSNDNPTPSTSPKNITVVINSGRYRIVELDGEKNPEKAESLQGGAAPTMAGSTLALLTLTFAWFVLC